MKRTVLALAVLAMLAVPAMVSAQQDAAAPAAHEKAAAILAVPDQIAWGPAPAILPAGARATVLEGNPSQPGPFTLRLSLPADYRIPPHFHPVTEHITVIEGTFYLGMGEVFDASKVTALPVGSFAALDAGMRHFALTKSPTVVQLHGVGPWSLTYVNPADDPRRVSKE